jgi:hypothetical protein
MPEMCILKTSVGYIYQLLALRNEEFLIEEKGTSPMGGGLYNIYGKDKKVRKIPY